MLLLPLDRPVNWRNPPLVTLFLVVLNCLCFFIWQHSDEELQEQAYQYYTESGLHAHEINAYYRYLNPGYRQTEAPASFSKNPKQSREMLRDGKFQHKLRNDEIITPQDKDYARWKPRRQHFDELQNQIVSYRYAINPASPSLLTLFTSMFLHGDVGHLLGNMVMFVLMGYVVEIILGHGIFLGGYLLAGLAGNALYVLTSPGLDQPGIGASGAVFGVLGMYLLLFGLRKIRFFFFLIYFNYFKAPAIIMLVPMILWQLYIEFGMDSNINVMAHLGGLAGGALVALLAKRFLSQHSRDYLDADVNKEKYQLAYSEGLRQVTSMNVKAARATFEALLRDYPHDLAVKQQLFNLYKLSPDSAEFHNLALQLLTQPGADRGTTRNVHDVFVEYAGRAKPRPQLTPDIMVTLALRFAANDFLADAEKIMNYLLHAKREFARNAEGLSALVKYHNGKDKVKAEHYKQLLLQNYPHSAEAQHLGRKT